jgi:hypothetical protein
VSMPARRLIAPIAKMSPVGSTASERGERWRVAFSGTVSNRKILEILLQCLAILGWHSGAAFWGGILWGGILWGGILWGGILCR